MVRAAALVALIACAHPPRPSEPPDPPVGSLGTPVVGRSHGVRQLAAPRPEIDISALVPDPTPELRWPLPPMVHPVLEPQYPIAPVFAAAGVGWRELCQRGVQNRSAPSIERALADYLRAWCHAANRDIDLAIDGLGRLRYAITPRLAEAATLDLANILVDAGSAEQAQRTLARASIDSLAVDDLLAATYAEVGALADAAVFNELALLAMGRDPERCHRLAKRLVLAGPNASLSSFDELERMAAAHDPTCVRLHHLFACWRRPGAICGLHFADVGGDPRAASLLSAYDRWPRGRSFTDEWRSIELDAIAALPLEGADHLATTALELAVRTSPCDGTLDALLADARRVRAEPTLAPQLDARLAALIAHAGELCAPD